MEKKTIYQRLAAVMREVSGIGKDQKNMQQGFNYRGIDDVMNTLHPLYAKHGLFVEINGKKISERITKNSKGNDMALVVAKIKIRFRDEEGNATDWEVFEGEAMDNGDKALNKCYSIAAKYWQLLKFQIPTKDGLKDPDAEGEERDFSHEKGQKKQPAKTQVNHEAYVKAISLLWEKHSEKVDGKQPIWAEIKAALAAKDYAKVQQLGETIKQLATLPTEQANEEAK